ncbi:MAG: DUF368 domain-containing protein [Planctomycetota bacterium]
MAQQHSVTSDAANFFRGALMGAADVVPGVSGGTVALVLGIYERLLGAVSHFDPTLIAKLGKRDFAAAARHIDLRFLAALGCGVVVAVVALAGVMHHLLEHHLDVTYAAFFGLILASSVLVGRMCRPQTKAATFVCVAIGIASAGAAFWLVSQDRLQGDDGMPYTFFSGAVAICAMILPGVSGSYLLLMLGKYHEITGIIKSVPKLEVTGGQLVTLAVFASGCLVGLLLFSRVLKWLLARFPSQTMAALCGMMVGSLYKIWPFQRDTTPSVEEFKEKVFQPYWPESFDAHTITCVAVAAAALVLVLGVDAIAWKRSAQKVA